MKKHKQKYLVIETTYFVDPHGEPDEAGETKAVKSGEYYDKLYKEWKDNKDKYLDGDEWTNDPSPSEDGYNSHCSMFVIRKIADDKAREYKLLIKAYKSIK